MDYLLNLDEKWLLAINGAHSPFWDSVMTFFSSIPVWIPLYVILAVCLFFPKVYGRNSHISTVTSNPKPRMSSTDILDNSRVTTVTSVSSNRRIPFWIIGLTCLCAVALCFGLTDRLSSIIKESVQRLRPCFEPSLASQVRVIGSLGGQYGFLSGHACSTFGLAMITSLIFKRHIYTILIFLWAFIVSYSRIYLARHYPLDVICGAILGVCIAVLVYFLLRIVLNRIHKLYQKKCSAL